MQGLAVARQAAADTGPAGLWIITDQPQPLALLRRAAPRPLRRLEDSIAGAVRDRPGTEPGGAQQEKPHKVPPSSLAERIELLAEEQFFTEPKSLADIQRKLAEHGWHYPQTNLSTPLIRLVRQRRLRRLQFPVGNKRMWKYTLP